MNVRKRAVAYGFMVLSLLAASAASSWADECVGAGCTNNAWSCSGPDCVGPRPSVSLGGRGSWFNPTNHTSDFWMGGAQVRAHVSPILAFEGSADYRQKKFGSVTNDFYPVQASLMLYLPLGLPVAPYALGGGGWYFSSNQTPGSKTVARFGPHVGAGLELFANRYFSIDADYRYIWDAGVPTGPSGVYTKENAHMVTAGVNLFLF